MRAAHLLADYIKQRALDAAAVDGKRDASRWLAERTSSSKDSWHRRFTYRNLVDYADLVEAAAVFGMEPAELIERAHASVGAREQDANNVTPITRKPVEELPVEVLEALPSAATRDDSDPREHGDTD